MRIRLLRLSLKAALHVFLSLLSFDAYASFIEATVGAAVVNDATATYYNPAALTLIKSPQVVGLGSIAFLHTRFNGQVTFVPIHLTQSGSSSSHTKYHLPSVYFGTPTNQQLFLGAAVIANSFNSDFESSSILRYIQSSNKIQSTDFVPAFGIKLNDYLSIGAGLNFSHAHFLVKPIIGFPGLNIPDSQSINDTSSTGYGGDIGFLIKPNKTILIGFEYRSAITYNFSGKSVVETHPKLTSNNYHFNYWTPARSTLTLSYRPMPQLGLIGTVQYLQWNIFTHTTFYNLATIVGLQPTIIPAATLQFHFRNTWLLTVASQYQVTSKWIVRAASSYIQSPSNGRIQISTGDSIVFGVSTSYAINKQFTIDGSYAHAFMMNQNINVITPRTIIKGSNQGARDAFSLKLSFNFI